MRRTYWVMGIIFVFTLASLWHFREQTDEAMQLGVPAEKYIVAQVDFAFPDEEATQFLKQEARRDIGTIFCFDPHQLQEVRKKLLFEGQWRNSLTECTYEELVRTLRGWEKRLAHLRFTDSRTLQKMLEVMPETLSMGMAGHQPQEKKNFLYTAASPRETNFWKELRGESQIDHYILSFFEKEELRLLEDKHREKALCHLVQSLIHKQYTKVEAGTSLLTAGEIVTGQHVEMLKAMRGAMEKNRILITPLSVLGSFGFALLFTLLGIAYLRLNHSQIFTSTRTLILLFSLLILTLALAKAGEYFLFPLEKMDFPLLVPFAAILICVLIGYEIALFSALFLSIVLMSVLPVGREEFIIINLVSSFVAVLFVRKIHKRREIFTVCAKTWACAIPVIIAFALCNHSLWNLHILTDFVTSALLLLFTAILAVGLLPIFENLFRVTTNMTLMEYMDPDHELLRRLSVEAPGTYQHSLVVSNLAEAAARAIHARDLFCRVSALYHDIGKLFNPHYYTENQFGGFDIHPLLTPKESAQVIISHVTEGAELARKKRLPPSFADIINQHHGTTLVYCFYQKQLEMMGNDPKQVEQASFRYPGPKPHSKESAIIMLADCVEAASRSLENFSEEHIAQMLDKLIRKKTEDGQFDECQLTFEELGMVKKAMVKTLLVASHLRVRYPGPTPTPSEDLVTS